MASEKDKCFQKAVERYEDVTGKDLGVKYEQQWVKDADGTWSKDPGRWQKIVGSIKKTLRIMSGEQEARPDGSANPVQLRRVDMTVTDASGREVVVDNKFTDADGNPDRWGKGGQSGSNQQGDYDDINKQNGVQGQDLQLNKDVCKCSATAEPEGVFVEETNPYHGRAPVFPHASGQGVPNPLPDMPVITPAPLRPAIP